MNYFASTLAWRYLTQKNQNNRIKIMLTVCFSGIFIGSFSLSLVLAVMNGFQEATYKALKNINAELEIHAYGEELAVPEINTVLKQEFPDIIAQSPYDIQQALVFTPHDASPTALIMLKAIDPHSESSVSDIEKKIIYPHNISLETILDDKVIIGKELAHMLSVHVGDRITIYFTNQQTKSHTITLDHKNITIGGIFFTGIDEFDTNLIMCTFSTLLSLFPHAGPTHISLAVKPTTSIEDLKKTLKERLKLEVISWKDRYPAIVAALQLEKYVMFFILVLITLVASTNIIALISMHIASKRTDIAILQAMGIPVSIIKRIFIYFGLILTTMATITGIICASIMSTFIDAYPCITLPDSYYVTTLPSKMSFDIAVLVFCVVLLVTCCALAIAIRMIHAIHITHVLRFEG